MRVALLEDDPSQMQLLSHWLQLAGHHSHGFEQGAALLRALEQDSFDALLLDWNLPDISGLEVLKRVRQLRSRIPIIFITARSPEADIVMALRLGADDYLVKPMRRMELLARLEAVTRRSGLQAQASQEFEVHEFRVNSEARRLLRNEQTVELTAKDFDLTVFFLRNLGRLLSRGHIREAVWKAAPTVTSRTLDTHVSRIRRKLFLIPEQGWRLVALYGYGYRLERLPEGLASRPTQAGSAPKEVGESTCQEPIKHEG